MTTAEKQAILRIARRINELASLENARFAFSKEEDAHIKKKITPYMTWFELTAEYLEDIANAEDKYAKRAALERTWDL